MFDKKAVMLGGHDNNCSLIALHQISNKSEEEIFKVTLRCGYNPRIGMTVSELENAFTELEVKHKQIYQADFENDETITVSQACKVWKDRVVVVCVAKHVFVIARGLVIDPNEFNYGLKRRVFYAYEIMNSSFPEYTRELRPETRLRFRVDPDKAVHRNSQNARSLLAMKFLEFVLEGSFSVHDALSQGLCKMSYIKKLVDTGVLLKIN